MPASAATGVSVGGAGNDAPASSATPTLTNEGGTSQSSLPVLRLPGLPASPRGGQGGAVLKAMTSSRHLASSADAERKRKLIRSVPILKQLMKEQHCTEDQLTSALRMMSFVDGEYIYCQGQAERDLYFIEDGKVLITQRRSPASSGNPGGNNGGFSAVVSAMASGRSRRRSVQDAEMEIQIHTHREHEYFGELALLQSKLTRNTNAVAGGAVVCFVILEHDFDQLLRPLHSLMLYRHLLQVHSVLEKDRMFKEWTPAQRQHLIARCHLQEFAHGDQICRQGEVADRYFILVEGEASIVLEETALASILSDGVGKSRGSHSLVGLERATTTSTVVAHKSIFQGFGEMGLLDKPRTADVVAVGTTVTCIVITRKHYITAAQLGAGGATLAIDVDAEALLATTLVEEWKLVVNARNLHLSNPKVSHYLVTFIKKFKAAYNQKFAGKTLYLDLFRRLNQESALADEFEFVASRITWDSPSSSLGIIRSETRRILMKASASRTAEETFFIGRLIERTAFIGKFDVPGPHIDKYKLARCLAKYVTFANISKDAYLFRQGKIESRAFLILRGKINIVNEDVGTINNSTAIKHHEVIATLSAGDSFGELSLVTRLQRSATTMAACDTDLLVLDRDHLVAVQAALPGVSVQQLMVKRAEFLSRLSFFRGSDFGQCIRVAHDLQEVVYDARHIFLQEHIHHRTLYIVKSGEIGVFMKIQVPVPGQTTPPGGVSSSGDKPASLPTTTKSALVRVATICAQEFFGVAIAHTGGVTTVAIPPGNSPTVSGSSSGTVGAHGAGEQWDLGSAVYMSTTHVEMLELSERGWRRLSPQCLAIVRNALLERHKWNESTAKKQQQRVQEQTSSSGVSTAYYQVEKPWQQFLAHMAATSSTGESMHLSSPAKGPTESMDSATNQCLTTRRTATHWLFSHIVGIGGVHIADTALFDDEGVLTAWLCNALHHQKATKTKTRARKDVVVQRRDVLELSLLRFEAHLQDLAKNRDHSNRQNSPAPQQAVAILYNADEPRLLSESTLDVVVRELCARQQSMTALEPDIRITRAYPGGRFVLQAASTSSHFNNHPQNQLTTETIKIVTRYSSDHGSSETCTHNVHPVLSGVNHDGEAAGATDDEASQKEMERWAHAVESLDMSAVYARAEAQCRMITRHLKMVHGICIRQVILEFACVSPRSDCQVILCSAQLVEWIVPLSHPIKPRERSHKKTPITGQSQEPSAAPASRTSSAFRVCRECRATVDVDLAREVLQQQTLVRGVLAKYQEVNRCRADAEARCAAAADRAMHAETRIVALETEILKVREQLSMQAIRVQTIAEEKHTVEERLIQVEEQNQQAERQIQEATTKIRELLLVQSQQIESVEQQTADQQREWDEQDARRNDELRRVHGDVERLHAECIDLRTLLEQARAEGDELRFQWAFVVRKLTDVGDAGVLPPKRIAGGYSSYPTPTAQNVEHVVKWIVDYEARRTILDAQQARRSPVKSVKRRLQMKVELMRLLASESPMPRSRSPSRRRSTRRTSSRSPHKKRPSTSPRRPSTSSGRDGVTLVHEHHRVSLTDIREDHVASSEATGSCTLQRMAAQQQGQQ